MPKAKPVQTPQVSGSAKPLPSLEEFRAAVKYALIHDHGMPDLYADELLDCEPEFVEQRRLGCHKGDNAIAKAADDLVFEPPKGRKWISLEKGQRVAEDGQVVLDADGAVGRYLDSLITLGLHGPDRDAVASAMLAKGIETVFPLIVSNIGRKAA